MPTDNIERPDWGPGGESRSVVPDNRTELQQAVDEFRNSPQPADGNWSNSARQALDRGEKLPKRPDWNYSRDSQKASADQSAATTAVATTALQAAGREAPALWSSFDGLPARIQEVVGNVIGTHQLRSADEALNQIERFLTEPEIMVAEDWLQSLSPGQKQAVWAALGGNGR